MTKQVAVYGGGIVAMLSVLSLHQQGFAVRLWRGPKATTVIDTKRVFALNHQSLAFLDKLGIPKPPISPIKNMYIWDGLSGASMILKAADKHQVALAYTVDEAALWQSIYQIMLDKGIPVFEHESGVKPVWVEDQWYLNETDAVSFLCIAEGSQSLLRDFLNVPCDRDDYHQLGIVAEVICDKPHQGVACQVFTPNGPLAFLPLLSEKKYSIVWSLDEDLAKNFVKLSTEDFLLQLNAIMGGQVGDCLQVSKRHAFPLKMVHAQTYHGKNWVLLGDSAHHFHPLAGLGLNAGIADVIALHQFKNPFTQANLARFGRERRAKISMLILGMKALKQGFANSHPWWVTLRGFGMDLINHERGLKKWMMSMVDEV